MKQIAFWKIAVLLVIILVATIGVYYLPPVHDRLSWRLDNLRAQIIYTFNPPQENVFVPVEESSPAADEAIVPPPSITPEPPTPTAAVQTASAPSPEASPTIALTATPIPHQVSLQGVVHEYQKWNNCGPSNLAMLLSYWRWQGTQMDTAAVLKPNPRDNNVSMGEMVAFVNEHTDFKAIMRVGGTLPLLKSLLAAGYPVMVEKGIIHNKEWMGHYQALTGYDDEKSVFIAQDSLITPDLPVRYAQMEEEWRVFDDLYMVVYPPQKEEQIRALMGDAWDEKAAFETALQNAVADTETLSGRDLAFAWFNVGTNLNGLQDFEGAAQAYDKYFKLYSALPKDQRPWRMMWYQNGPYEAYYRIGRYKDVISLASVTLSGLTEKLLEEACTWRALAKEKSGDVEGAVIDLEEALRRNPNYAPARKELEKLKPGAGSVTDTAAP